MTASPDNPSTEPQAGTSEQDDPTQATAPEQPQEGTEEPKTFDAEYVTNLRQEAAEHRVKARDAEQQVTTLTTERDQLATERDTLATERDDYRSKYHDLLKAKSINDAALAARAIDTDAVAALIAGQVTIDEQGQVTGVTDAINALAQSKPHLFNNTPAASRDATAGRNTPPALNSSRLEESLRKAVGAK